MVERPESDPLPPYHPHQFVDGLEDEDGRPAQISRLIDMAAFAAHPDPESELVREDVEAILAEVADRAAKRNIDVLTGLPDKSAFTTVLRAKAEMYRRTEGDQGFDVVVADLADFGVINKTRGHSVGDQVLKDVAKTFKGYRSTDQFFRWGGDEFFVIVPEGQGREVADRLGEDLGEQGLHAYCGISSTADIGDSTLSAKHLCDLMVRLADMELIEEAKQYKTARSSTD